MISYLTAVVQRAEERGRRAVEEGDDAHADYMFRVAEAALDLLKVLVEEPA